MTNGHIILRKYRIGDEFALYEGISESIEELTHWGFYHVGFALEDAKTDVISRIENWTEGKAYSFLIEEIPGPVFVGNCGVDEFEPERNHAGVGWWVRTSQTGKGIAAEAARLLAQAAFEDLNLTSLGVCTNADNAASRRVAEKIGAVLIRIKSEDDGSSCAVYELKEECLLSR
jgi:ribosomal-protein-serine acetyltransferase